jgi:hypothetical protein
MTKTDKKTTWMVKHVDELPVEYIEGIKMIPVLEGTAFDNIGCEFVMLERGQKRRIPSSWCCAGAASSN